MRTTIDLPDDVYQHARNLAHDRHTTLSQAVVELIERGMTRLPEPQLRKSPITGLTVMHFGGPVITAEDVRSLEDDE
jgi:hypothetical protein